MAIKKLLESIGNEKIKSITIVRTPLSSLITTVANLTSQGDFQKAVSNKGYDTLFHLSLWINNKYNLEKNEKPSLTTVSPIKSNSQTKMVNIIPNNLTFNTLIDRTKRYMGSSFDDYNFETNNCQDFLLAILNSNRIGNPDDRKFIKQDISTIVKTIPSLWKTIGNIGTKVAGFFHKMVYGDGRNPVMNKNTQLRF